MDIDFIRNYCLAKQQVEETLPFGPDVLVFKVAGKLFLLCPLDTETLQINIKCMPELAESLREQYDCVLPGYHMNKKHWNTVIINGTMPLKTIKEWIDISYKLVVESLPKKVRENLKD